MRASHAKRARQRYRWSPRRLQRVCAMSVAAAAPAHMQCPDASTRSRSSATRTLAIRSVLCQIHVAELERTRNARLTARAQSFFTRHSALDGSAGYAGTRGAGACCLCVAVDHCPELIRHVAATAEIEDMQQFIAIVVLALAHNFPAPAAAGLSAARASAAQFSTIGEVCKHDIDLPNSRAQSAHISKRKRRTESTRSQASRFQRQSSKQRFSCSSPRQ